MFEHSQSEADYLLLFICNNSLMLSIDCGVSLFFTSSVADPGLERKGKDLKVLPVAPEVDLPFYHYGPMSKDEISGTLDSLMLVWQLVRPKD